MHFESRELEPFARPLNASELNKGSIYFSVNYFDEEMTIPHLEPLVFVGKDLNATDSGQLYFQDVDSHRRGIQYNSSETDSHAKFFRGGGDQIKHIFRYERALEELMRCSLRRTSVGE